MPATKPSTVPGWNVTDTHSAGSPVVEPDNTFKTTGYQSGDKLFAQFLNWFSNNVSRWIEYVRDIEGNAHFWTASNLFDFIVTFGQALVGSAGDAQGARQYFPTFVGDDTTAAKTHIFFFDVDDFRVSLWVSRGPTVEIVVNADWNNTTKKWSKTLSGAAASVLRVSPTSITIAGKLASENTAWDDTFALSTGWSTKTALFDAVGNAALAWGLVLGTAILGTAVNAAAPRLRMLRAANATSARTLMFEWADPTGSGYSIRLYRSNFDTEGYELAFNCVWGVLGSQRWFHDGGNTATSTLIQISSKRLAVLRTTDGTIGDWADDVTGWDGGFPYLVYYWGNDETRSSAFKNALVARAFPKAIATLNFDGSGSNPTIDTGSFNITSAAFTAAGSDEIKVIFASPFVGTDFALLVQLGPSTRLKIAGGTDVAAAQVIQLGKTTSGGQSFCNFTLYTVDSTHDAEQVLMNSGSGSTNFVGQIQLVAFGKQ